MDFEQHFRSPTRSRSIHHFRDLHFHDREVAICAASILNSNLFFFWFQALGNGRNLTGEDVSLFPAGSFTNSIKTQLSRLFEELMEDYKAHSFIRQRSDCEYQEFRPSESKPIMDQIDKVLAKHYGFAEEDLDFIINYEIKYRMGIDGNDD